MMLVILSMLVSVFQDVILDLMAIFFSFFLLEQTLSLVGFHSKDIVEEARPTSFFFFPNGSEIGFNIFSLVTDADRFRLANV